MIAEYSQKICVRESAPISTPPKGKKDPLASFWKFPCRPNDKTPACRWKEHANQQASFDPTRFNTGIPTGSRNNLLFVDLDIKDDGVTEFGKYIQAFGKPQTMHVVTPSGGEHYYFNYSHTDSGTQELIKTFLNNSTKFRGKGIDIRSEGGYIVGPPSTRDGRPYALTSMTSPCDIPLSLVAWLLEGSAGSSPTKKGAKGTRVARAGAEPSEKKNNRNMSTN